MSATLPPVQQPHDSGRSSHHTKSKPYPLGATWDGHGVQFAVASLHAEAIEVVLLGTSSSPRLQPKRVVLSKRQAPTFHQYVEDIGPGERYVLHVHGPQDASHGHRFDPTRALLDPYARAVTGARDTPIAVVVDNHFDWEGDQPVGTPLDQTIIYEVHVKGFSKTHPKIAADLRGMFGGLASPAAIAHFKSLGVTAVELLPVAVTVDDAHLKSRGLVNYWGYQPVGYFAPDARFSELGAEGGQVRAFKQMVKSLHQAGIEVILDVVYNHTGEGDERGPTINFRGIDNATYYRLGDPPSRYVDVTGCGNTLDLRAPLVLQLVMDSLRYWATEMHVDGFRFDLATALARGRWAFDPGAPFLAALLQDPVLRQRKLIMEPWDIGEGGYQVGGFPLGTAEWNGKYRDAVRRFWNGYDASPRDFATRFAGSSDLYGQLHRGPLASVNFITAHDGFTLRDLLTYPDKQNEANGESNRDGESHNNNLPLSGELRKRQTRNLLATLLLSQGVPMLLGGDELGRTQRGNNNAYCQDNEISWFDWTDIDVELAVFVKRLITLRQTEPTLRRTKHFRGQPADGRAHRDAMWFRPDGHEMTGVDWDGPRRTLGVRLDAEQALLIVWNTDRVEVDVTLPSRVIASHINLPNAPTPTDSFDLLVDTAGARHPASPMAPMSLRVWREV